MYLSLPYVWANKSYILSYKEENDVSCKKLLCLWLWKNVFIIKTICNYCEIKTTDVVKNLFQYKDRRHLREASLLYIIFLTRNDLVIELFNILRLTIFGYSFIHCLSYFDVCSAI